MREILLTSSVLILALLALRRVFREKISRRVQYALWALVLVRLLVPVSLPALDFSVLTMAQPVRETISARLEALASDTPAFNAPAAPAIPNPQPQIVQGPQPGAAEPTDPAAASPSSQPPAAPADRTETPEPAPLLTLTGVTLVWLTGTAGMAMWLLVSNLRFAVKLRRSRISMDIPGCKRPVYLVESGLPSPCLFGIIRPAIYLTPAATASEDSLRHVLAHELTHARHLDPLWALLRGVCLTVYWFDPLVWIAASAAKTDCELACDEGAIRRLGEEERLAYGRTLLSLIPIRRLPGNPLLSATTMSSDKKRLKDRLTRIAENRRTQKLALCIAALLTAGACVLTFAGCAEDAAKETDPPPADATPADATPVDAMPVETTPVDTTPADTTPSGPTVYPAGEPLLTIPLTDLTPFEPQAVETTQGVDSQVIDLDGDGTDELLRVGSTYAWLTFRRDGALYEADVAALLAEAWPEADYTFFTAIDPQTRCLSSRSGIRPIGDNGAAFYGTAFRSIWFDGESLLVYKVDRTAVDHVTPGVTAPPDVMAALRRTVREQMEERVQGEGLADAGINDWRIVSVTGPWVEQFDGLTVEIYRYNYELHATAPEQVGLAGGIYVDEDGWVSPGYPDCDYLCFRLEADGSRSFLFTLMENTYVPGDEWFRDSLEWRLGLSPAQQVQAVWDELTAGGPPTISLETADGGGGAYDSALGWNRPSDLTFNYTWETLAEDELPSLDDTDVLTVGHEGKRLTLYDAPEVVRCESGGRTRWYHVTRTYGHGDTLFEGFRLWFDKVEQETLRSQIVIPDDGRSREEIAQAWTDAYEGVMLNVTSGSSFKCTYVDVRDVLIDNEHHQDFYPVFPDGREVFYFSYSLVFVTEEPITMSLMAGNTDEYEGSDAPEGAYQYWRCGYLYLDEDGWRCSGVGTGP